MIRCMCHNWINACRSFNSSLTIINQLISVSYLPATSHVTMQLWNRFGLLVKLFIVQVINIPFKVIVLVLLLLRLETLLKYLLGNYLKENKYIRTQLDSFIYEYLTACVYNFQIHPRIFMAWSTKRVRICSNVTFSSSMANLHNCFRSICGQTSFKLKEIRSIICMYASVCKGVTKSL